MTKRITPRSGSSKQTPPSVHLDSGITSVKKIPLWAYPEISYFRDTPEVKGLLCYIMKHYGDVGINVMIERKKAGDDVEVMIRMGDWSGEGVDLHAKSALASYGLLFMDRYAAKFVEIMKLTGIPMAQFYLTPIANDDGNFIDLRLVDLRFGPNKFSGPGMVRDIFGASIPTPEVIKIAGLDDDIWDMIDRGLGSYAGNIIIKPSRFRTVERDTTLPLYVEICR